MALFSSYALSCEDIYGEYTSHSETHWSFVLKIDKDGVLLTYTDYWYGERDLRTDQTVVSQGYCELVNGTYELTFAQNKVDVRYHHELSHASFGQVGSSPGLTGEFIEGQEVELWKIN